MSHLPNDAPVGEDIPLSYKGNQKPCFRQLGSYFRFKGYLAAGVLIAQEVEDTFGRYGKPEGGCSAEDNTGGTTRVIDALSGHNSDIICAGAGKGGPLVSGGGADSRAEAHDHPLRQLQHALSPFW